MQDEPTRTSLGSLTHVLSKYIDFERLYQYMGSVRTSTQRMTLYGVELLIIQLWAIMVTLPFLDFRLDMMPGGLEYNAAIQTFYFWENLQQCGACALWNGALNGGAPALADTYGATLHPLVAILTLIFGVPIGAKLALVGTFLMAGFGQWWLAYEIGLGRAARVWSALLAIAGGHLAGRFQYGNLGLVLSTAAVTLALPPLLRLARKGDRRSAVLLGITLALVILAGQGYHQIGFALMLVAAPLLLPADRARWGALARQFLLAAGLAVLLAAPLLVPVANTISAFEKDVDIEFSAAQPLSFLPLNLVINEREFYYDETLGKTAFPFLYVNYIGWIPVILAVVGLAHHHPGSRRVRLFLASIALIAFWLASADPFRMLTAALNNSVLSWQIGGLRNIVVVAGLAVPPILALAAIGIEQLLRLSWPRLALQLPGKDPSAISANLRWLTLLPAVLALMNAYTFNRQWIETSQMDAGTLRIVDSLRSPELRWINPPFGEPVFLEYAVRQGLKVSAGFRPWSIGRRPPVEPEAAAFRGAPPEGWSEIAMIDTVTIAAAPPGNEYAAIVAADGSRTICAATGLGGDIDVRCASPAGGILTIKEYSWPGWRATIDQASATLLADPWLSVAVPPGDIRIALRYRPWDVPLGVALCIGGIILAGVLFRQKPGDQC